MDAPFDPGLALCQAHHLLNARLGQRQQLVTAGWALEAKEWRSLAAATGHVQSVEALSKALAR